MATASTTTGTAPTVTKRKRSPGPRKNQTVLAHLKFYNSDQSEFQLPAGVKIVATKVERDLRAWAINQAKRPPGEVEPVVVIEIPQNVLTTNAKTNSEEGHPSN